MEHPENLLKDYRRHLYWCEICRYADIYVPGCTIGNAYWDEYSAGLNDWLEERTNES